MTGYAILALSVLAGYCVTVACALVLTMGLGSASPRFVIVDHRVRTGFKLMHEGFWFVGVVLGAMVTAKLGMGVNPWRQEMVLAGVLLIMLWRNTWEARQRGTAHQILISFLTLAGVPTGFSLFHRLMS